MSQEESGPDERWSLPVKQSRSRETRDRLIAAGFRLLRRKNFDALCVADIARAANCSVGAFYVRFVDKDQYFLALVERFRVKRRAELEELYERTTMQTLVGDVLRREFLLVGEHLNLWRAALRKGVSDPAFWEEFRGMGRQATDRFLQFYGSHLGRTLTAEEESHIRFAFQMVRGTLNNTILNEPGPLKPDDPEFLRQTERAFRLVAGLPPRGT